MTPELKARWVAALRSGEYEQGGGALRRSRPQRPDEFCCLGVLCDLVKSDLGLAWVPLADSVIYKFDDRSGSLSPAVADRLGLEEDIIDRLIEYNDGDRLPFTAIADFIERTL